MDCEWRAFDLPRSSNWYVVHLRETAPTVPATERCHLTFFAALSDLVRFEPPDGWTVVAAYFMSTHPDGSSLVQAHHIQRVLALEEPGAAEATYMLEVPDGKYLSVPLGSSTVVKEHTLQILKDLTAVGIPTDEPTSRA